jgi:hypothetical protein
MRLIKYFFENRNLPEKTYCEITIVQTSIIFTDRRKSKQICISLPADKNKQTNKQRLETGTAPSNVDNNSEKKYVTIHKRFEIKKKRNNRVFFAHGCTCITSRRQWNVHFSISPLCFLGTRVQFISWYPHRGVTKRFKKKYIYTRFILQQ